MGTTGHVVVRHFMNKQIPHVSLLLAAVGSLLVLTGCAGTQPKHPAQTLAAAGFKLRTPETPKQKEIFASLPAYKVQRLTVKGQTYYIYKDESKGFAMVGREAEYQRYRQLAKQDKLADSSYEAMQMGTSDAYNWSSEYALSSDWR